MKTFLNLCCAASLLCLLSFAASDLELWTPAGVAGKTDGSVARIAPSSATFAFSSHVRFKVLQYFDTYRTDPLGLPPACAAGMKVDGIPAAWERPEIASGTVIRDIERSFLVDAPAELVRVLPARSQVEVRYYLAGGNLVAVDPGYKVLDSIRIPTVRLSNEPAPVGPALPLQLVRHGMR